MHTPAYAQWQKMFESLVYIYEFTSNANYIFCATGPKGVFRSSNNGLTWDSSNTGLLGRKIRAITAKGNYIFAGTDSGLFRSSNNGNTWSSIHQNIYYTFVFHLECNEQYVFAGTLKGLFRSTNYGATWDSINTGLPYQYGRVVIDALTVFNDTLYAGVQIDPPQKKVYKSTNNGNYWDLIEYNNFDSVLVYSLQAKDNSVLCGTHKGVFISKDAGWTWRKLNEINPNIGLFGFSILDNDNIVISSFGYGVQVTTNGGVNWTFRNEGLLPDEYFPCALYSSGIYTYMGTNPFSYMPAIFRRVTQQLIPVLENNVTIPDVAELYQNYPNPFNSETKISFSIPSSEGYGFSRGVGLARLTVFDISGREIETLVNKQLSPGTYSVIWNAADFPSGVYFCRLQSGSSVSVKKTVLIK